MNTPKHPKRLSVVTGLKRPVLKDVLKYLIAMAAVIWLIINGTQQLGYNWQ